MAGVPAGLAEGVTGNVSALVGSVSGHLPSRDQVPAFEVPSLDLLRHLAEAGSRAVQAGVDPALKAVATNVEPAVRAVQANMGPDRRRRVLVPVVVVAVAAGVFVVARSRRCRPRRRWATRSPLPEPDAPAACRPCHLTGGHTTRP